MLLSEEEQGNANSFYSPLCKSLPYLTPEQRKKLREKRKIELSPTTTNGEETLKPSKKRRILSQKHKHKTTVKKVPQKKAAKVGLPEVCCTAAEWVPQSKTSSENKKFFKTRSPEHLKKAKFVLEYKKSRLDFVDDKLSSPKSVQNSSKVDKSDANVSSASKIEENHQKSLIKMTENPHVVRVASIQKEFSQIISEETASSLVLESISDVPSDNKDARENCSISASEIAQCVGKTEGDNILKPMPETSKTEIYIPDSVPTSSNTNNTEESKLTSKPKNYPIFDKEKIKKIKWDISPPDRPFSGLFRTKDKSKGCEQMIIDAGQNKIGAHLCKTCGMIYTIGHEEDEKLHSENHDMYLQLKFPGWKDERVIGSYDDGRVIKILKDDKNFKLKKVQDILLVVNRELGFPSAIFNQYLQGKNVMIILFISKEKFVKGCVVAESIPSASPVVMHYTGLSKSYYASAETVPAICGINRIWVARENRKQKIASRMVDCLRSNFILGLVVSLKELAFTDPTEDGMQFAASYTGTENFLVYK